MILTDTLIADAVHTGSLQVKPFRPELLQPASLDVTLGNQFVLLDRHDREYIDPRQPQLTAGRRIEVGGDQPFVLHPGEFALGYTVESFTFPADVAGRIEGKSSLGRLGLLLHSTAGWIDPGFEGQLTLELSNAAPLPVRLWPGDPIGQVCFLRCAGAAERPYGHPGLNSRYQGQQGPTPARPGPVAAAARVTRP